MEDSSDSSSEMSVEPTGPYMSRGIWSGRGEFVLDSADVYSAELTGKLRVGPRTTIISIVLKRECLQHTVIGTISCEIKGEEETKIHFACPISLERYSIIRGAMLKILACTYGISPVLMRELLSCVAEGLENVGRHSLAQVVLDTGSTRFV